jgi:hemerythrin superfamily protein
MRAELIAHAKAEEEVVYRPLREHVDAELIELSFDDHEEIERLLADLSSSSAEDNKWLGTLRALKQVVLQHVEMEETDLFRLAQRNFTPREAEQIALDMLEEKGRLTMENPFAIMSRKFKEFIHGESHR